MLVVTKFNKNIDAVLPIVLLSSKCPLERYTHIAFLIEKGVQPLVISQRVGHDSVNTTMNIYGHLYPNKQRQIADMLNCEATGEQANKVVSLTQGYGNRASGMW